MTASDLLRALLTAEIACEMDTAPPEAVLEALRAAWQPGRAPPDEFLDVLARTHAIAPETREDIQREVVRRLADPGGRRAPATGGGGPAGGMPPLRRVAEGRYVDFAPVGQGGMGTVYWALDTELSRQVAFKVVRAPAAEDDEGITPSAPFHRATGHPPSPDSASFDALCLRFLQEAWVTGGMEHPGIVPVYELGETEGGVPYYTMRFVRGSRTLATAIEESGEVPVERRLDLLLEPYLKVCDTVRYAHSCGVIHRDLKPDNVALGEYGEVVVLDWGLARVEGSVDVLEDPWAKRVSDLRTSEALQTVASVLGTPGYMSPEAARGESRAVDERSDVYSLGVIFFQILTGRLPFTFRTTSEYREQVLAHAPPDPREIDPAVPARLASLCRQALAREPSERPPSADAFAGAIRSWRTEAARDREVDLLMTQSAAVLDSAAVLRGGALLRELDRVTVACRRVLDLTPDHAEARAHLQRIDALRERGIEERERRARHRTLRRVGAAVLGAGVVAAVVVAGLLEARRREAADARRQAEVSQARAEADRARAEDVMGFMVFELQESLEPLGRLDVLAKIGTKARTYYASLPREGLSVASLLGHTVTLRRLGEVYEARGDLPAALEAYRLAADVAARILADAPDDAVGRYHRSLAEARIGMALLRQGYASDAKHTLLEHREDVLRLLESHPDDPEYLDALASAHAAIGHILRTDGKWAEAEEACTEALEIACALEAQESDDPEWVRIRLGRQLDLSRMLGTNGKESEAVALIQSTLDEVRRHVEERRLASDVRWSSLEASSLFALALIRDSQVVECEQRWEAAHAAYRQLSASDPDNDNWRVRIAHALGFLGIHHMCHGDQEKAPVLLGQAFEIGKALIAKDPSNASWRNLLITLCDRMARQCTYSGDDMAQARSYRLLAVEQARRLREFDPSNAKWRHILAFTLSHLGRTWVEEDPAVACLLLAESVAAAEELYALQPASNELAVLLGESRVDLGLLHLREGRRPEGLREWRRALDDLYACWELRPGGTGLLAPIRWVDGHLTEELARGDEKEREEARRRGREAIRFVARWRSEEGPRLAPALVEELATWDRELKDRMEALLSSGATER